MISSKHLLPLALLVACNAFPISLSKDNGKMSIDIDERVELVTIMQSLADYPDYFKTLKRPAILDSTYRTVYLSDIDQYFSGYKSHPSIEIMRKFIRGGLLFQVPLSFALHLSNPPKFEVAIPLDEGISGYAGLAKDAQTLINAMAAFYQDTDFEKFYKENQGYYKQVMQNTRKEIPDLKKYVQFLETFSGVKARSYKIILSTVFSYNNYAFSIVNGKDTTFYNVTSPGFKYGPHPAPIVAEGVPRYQKYALEFILTHEFSHSYINPMVEGNTAIVDSIERLFTPIEDVMGKLGYPTWYSCLEEHLARAVTAVYFKQEYGDEAAMKEIKNQKDNWNFIYIEDIYKLDEEYLRHRDKYGKYGDFYPEIIASLSKIDAPVAIKK